MRLLALDQSLSSTGFALWDETMTKPQSGAWPLCEGVKNRARGFVQIHKNIAQFHKQNPIDYIIFEQPIKTPKDKLETLIGLYGLAAHIESYACIKGIRFGSVSQQKWRSTWLGADAKSKKSVDLKRLAVLRSRQFGLDPITHDEAEAIGILDHQMHILGIIPKWRIDNPMISMIE